MGFRGMRIFPVLGLLLLFASAVYDDAFENRRKHLSLPLWLLSFRFLDIYLNRGRKEFII